MKLDKTILIKSLFGIFASSILLSCTSQNQNEHENPSESIDQSVLASKGIPGQFIVTLAEDADLDEVVYDHGVQPLHMYRSAIKGFAGSISEAARAGLMGDERVVSVEQDQLILASSLQAGATWGLDRIDQRGLPLSSDYSFEPTGAGVSAYIIDTGIRLSHQEFAGRASFGFDAFGSDGGDCNGHGTHVSGTVGGNTYGVAKNVNLIAVRVLDCNGSGTTSGVIAGVDWVTQNRILPAVANISLGGGASFALDSAVQKMIFSGVATAVAAGNENKDACNSSPSRVADAMTIGASGANDSRASWSNFGKCVDWFAPGVGIASAWSTGDTDTNTISGTSMATPHTAGVAALYLESHPTDSPIAVRDALLGFTTKGIVTASSSDRNHLLYSFELANGTGDYISPTASIASPANNSVVARRASVTIQSNATDNLAVQKVEFFLNGSRICTDSVAPFTCVWKASAYSANVQFQTKSYDAAGNVGTSQVVNVIVK